jgi:hypothetical protein
VTGAEGEAFAGGVGAGGVEAGREQVVARRQRLGERRLVEPHPQALRLARLPGSVERQIESAHHRARLVEQVDEEQQVAGGRARGPRGERQVEVDRLRVGEVDLGAVAREVGDRPAARVAGEEAGERRERGERGERRDSGPAEAQSPPSAVVSG